MSDGAKRFEGPTHHAELTATVKLLQRQGKLSGVANDGVKDRVGDIVVADGAEADELPFPLLLDHDARAPIGIVTRLWASRGKLRFEAQLAKPAADTPMATRVAEAVARLDAGVTSVSIGFRGIEAAPLPDGGILYKRVSIYELSLVSVPASPGSRVESHKAIGARSEGASQPTTIKALLDSAHDTSESRALRDFIMAEGQRAIDEALAEGNFKAGMWAGQLTAIAARTAFDFTIAVEQRTIARIADLERRLEEQGRAYKGVWRPGTYAAGCFVTHAGSMWHADKSTDFKPGEGGGWTLAVKSGRDGKDAK
jgi:HK97 family phage prohead protease